MKTLKHSVLAALAATMLLCFNSCKRDDPEPDNPPTLTKGGTWNYAGGYFQPSSWRNLHYMFSVSDYEKEITIEVESESGTNLIVHVPDASPQPIISDDATSFTKSFTVERNGEYEIIVCADEWQTGSCTVKVSGLGVDSFYQLTNKHSETETEEIESAGGWNSYNSPRNHQYRLTTLKTNAYVDLSFIASDAAHMNVSVYANSKEMASGYEARSSITAYQIGEAGTYIVTVAAEEFAIGDYQLFLDGKEGEVSELERIEYAHLTDDKGNWESGGGYNDPSLEGNRIYSFEVTENESYIDVVLTTTNQATHGQIALMAESEFIYDDTEDGHRVSITSSYLPKAGLYKIGVMTEQGQPGDFTLEVFGNVANLTNLTP